MGHYAKVLNGIVQNVIVADAAQINLLNSDIVNSTGVWIKTSYNTRGGVHYQPNTNIPSEDQSKALRKNFAAIGMIYDQDRDAFYWSQPYPSWTLNEESCKWEPPVPHPHIAAEPDSDEMLKHYCWDESTTNWVETPEPWAWPRF